MRFIKGSQVEVLRKKELSTGEWCRAKIISGNGHTYSVIYEGSFGMNNALVERVPRKAIRPCPPMANVESLAVGDVVEVFDDDSWKAAKILKVLGANYCSVSLLGSSEDIRVQKTNIRVRQSWKDDKWVVIGKGPRSCDVEISNKPCTLNCNQMNSEFLQFNSGRKKQAGNDHRAARDNTCFQESPIVSSRTLKRLSPYRFSYIEEYTRKRRAVEKEGDPQRYISESPSPLLKKVDAVAYPRVNLGEKYMHASSNNQTTGYIELERGDPNDSVLSFHERSSEPTDCDSVASSVGSCSVVSNSPNKFSGHNLSGPTQDADTLCSDADSSYDCGDEERKYPLSQKEDVAARIHRLELHAYRCTLEAIYASGPLSWEQEALLTNLRISLNISNDEHLMEIRNLKSAGTGLHLS